MKTKQNQLKNYVQLGILFFGITLFLFNCEKEDELQNLSLPQSNVKTYPIAKEKIPDIVNYINVNKKSKGNFSCGTIDYTTIFTTIDSLEVQTYSFPFEIEGGDDSNTFYNFVVRTSPDQTYRSFVFKYTPSNDYERGENHFDYFNGSLKIYDYDTFCNAQSTTGRTDDESPCPTNDITIYGSGSGSNAAPNSGGGGSENGGANYNSGSDTTGSGSTAIGYVGSSSSPCTVTIMTSCASGGTTPHSRKSCGSNTGVPYAEVNCAPNDNRTDDPCSQAEDFSGAASINTGRILKNIKERLTMTSERIAWLNNSENNVEIVEIAQFLEENNYSEEAIAEAEEMIDAEIIEDKIVTDDLDSCSKGIFEKLKNIETNDIAKVLQRFGDISSTYNWTLETNSGSNFQNSNNSVETNWLDGAANNYLTQIKESYVNNATNLSIARTILHEAIHAYILSYLDGTPTLFQQEFPELWNDFVAKKYGIANNELENYHHQEMARNFITIIGDALSEYDNHQLNNQNYYESLAWGALINTDAFSTALAPAGYMTQSEQEAIVIVNNQEDTNSPEAKGTPCN